MKKRMKNYVIVSRSYMTKSQPEVKWTSCIKTMNNKAINIAKSLTEQYIIGLFEAEGNLSCGLRSNKNGIKTINS
jgi:hypothetical protein